MSPLWKQLILHQTHIAANNRMLGVCTNHTNTSSDTATITDGAEWYACKEAGCNLSFKSSRDFINHRINHAFRDTVSTWLCPFTSACEERRFSDLFDARSHLTDHHKYEVEMTLEHIDHMTKLQEMSEHEVSIQRESRGSIYEARVIGIQYDVTYFDVGDFKVESVSCGIHDALNVFVCHDCQTVPACLAIHLKEVHRIPTRYIARKRVFASLACNGYNIEENQHEQNPNLQKALAGLDSLRDAEVRNHFAAGFRCKVPHCNYANTSEGYMKAHAYFVHNKLGQDQFEPVVAIELLNEQEQVLYAISP
ncbi:hypothetical protein GQ42DRAFT_55489 [Ramicandelaber brevisporus]|nr:hypothetical protein GQ42DRAFT_55489 [Ramicandelaber brevisporus]